MPAPIGKEFGRVFEEQNLGIPVDDSLSSLTERVPNLDLKFFATAIVLQRQTGGDLAEILDKIGYIVRERFKIWGQVQALTGEGRLSGIVLLGLPPVLFLAVYRLNPDYVMMLFHGSDGQENAGRCRGHAGARRACDPQDHQHQGISRDLRRPDRFRAVVAAGHIRLVCRVRPGGCWTWLATGRPRAVQRLDEMKNPCAPPPRSQRGVTKKQDAMTKVLEAASPALAAPLQPKSELEASKLKVRLSNAGFRGEVGHHHLSWIRNSSD